MAEALTVEMRVASRGPLEQPRVRLGAGAIGYGAGYVGALEMLALLWHQVLR